MAALIATAFANLFTVTNVILMIIGVVVGIIFGCVPGLSAAMAIALFLPVTFGLPQYSAFALLMALYIGGVSGSLISAILINVPGSSQSIATCYDGHPMAVKGEAHRALGTGMLFSFLGTMFSLVILIFAAPTIASVAVKLQPFEFFSLVFFALLLIICISGANLFKSLLAGLLGMAVSFVGNAPVDSIPRFTFHTNALVDGFALLPMVIGLFAVTTIMGNAARPMGTGAADKLPYKRGKGFGFTFKEFLGQTKNWIMSAVIGTFIGFLPGMGGSLANQLAYAAVQKTSKHPEKFGTGMSGCEVWIGQGDAFFFTERRDLIAFEDHVAPFRIDHFYDYEKPIEFGGMTIWPVHCPGHTPGTTCLFFDVEHEGRKLTLGIHGGLGTNGLSTLELQTNGLPLHLQSDYLNTLTVLKDRKVDVLIPSHAGHAVDYPFFEIAARDDGTGNGFIDPGAWKRMIESRIDMVKALMAKEKAEEAANKNN